MCRPPRTSRGYAAGTAVARRAPVVPGGSSRGPPGRQRTLVPCAGRQDTRRPGVVGLESWAVGHRGADCLCPASSDAIPHLSKLAIPCSVNALPQLMTLSYPAHSPRRWSFTRMRPSCPAALRPPSTLRPWSCEASQRQTWYARSFGPALLFGLAWMQGRMLGRCSAGPPTARAGAVYAFSSLLDQTRSLKTCVRSEER